MLTLLFFISTLGYIFCLRRYTHLNTLTLPLFIFAGQTLLMHFFGIMGYLQVSIYINFFFGLLFFFLWLLNKIIIDRNISLSIFKENIHFLIFLSVLLIYVFVISDSLLNHYDNFSHWAKIVKFLFFEQRLPHSTDNFIGFLSYPLGSSLFINYFVNIVGFTEGNMLVGQFLLITASLISLFGLIKNQSEKYFYTSIILLIIGSFYHFNISGIDELLVDFLMPIIGIGYLAGIYLNQNNFPFLSLFTLVVGSHLILVKNSASIFMVVGFIIYLWLAFKKIRIRDLNSKLIAIYTLITSLLILLTYKSWTWHLSNIIDPNSIPKHTVNFSNYKDIFNNKSPEVVEEIISLFLQRLVEISNRPTIGLLIVIFLYFFSHIVLKYLLKRKSKILHFFIYNSIFVILYYIGLLATYLYSMPTAEALRLAAFNRYSYTIIIYSLGMFTLAFLIEFQKYRYPDFSFLTRSIFKYSSLFFMAIILLVVHKNIISNIWSKTGNYDATLVRNAVADESHQFTLDNSNYLIYYNSDNENPKSLSNGYLKYLSSYYLFSNNINLFTNVENITDNINSSTDPLYLVVLNADDSIQNYMDSEYNLSINEPGIYQLSE